MSSKAGSSEVCPSCGNFADERGLSEFTGWCAKCTHQLAANVTSPSSGVVPSNTVELALAANSIAVQHYLAQGLSVWQALDVARLDRPRCIVCGNVIQRSRRSVIFCRKTAECRRYSRRYVYLYQSKGMTKVEALAAIIKELTGDS